MMRSLLTLTSAAVLAASLSGCAHTPLASTPAQDNADRQCRPNPYGKRDLFLRGSFNSWNPREAFQFTYHCDRFELVTSLTGEHTFKIADDSWSKDADFGGRDAKPDLKPDTPLPLQREGSNLHYTFKGHQRMTLTMERPGTSSSSSTPTLTVSDCPEPPLGKTMIYLRGSMNNWTALDDYAFEFRCDGYYLNVSLAGRHEFKIADTAWSNAATIGAPGSTGSFKANQPYAASRGTDPAGAANLVFEFAGEQTLKLAFDRQGDTLTKPTLTIGPKSFTPRAAKEVTDPVATSLRHDTRSLSDKSPFGAVTAGTTVEFGLNALPGVARATMVLEKRRLEGNQEVLEYTEVARLPLLKQVRDGQERWSVRHRFDAINVYGYYFEVEIAGKTYLYQNNKDAIHWTREVGSNGLGKVEEPPAESSRIRRFRHTVFRGDFTVPAWARDAVYYYIFPDRFRNGDPRNDAKPGVDTYHDKNVEFHTNWLDKPYLPGSGDGSDDVYTNDFFGGDLAGIIEKLDYLADLGVNTLYLTPVFTAASNHKYDTADYRNIDPRFGSNDDYVRLTKEAAKRGIRVIADVSLNHTGSDSIYFDRYAKYSAKTGVRGAFEGAKVRADSPYADWYKFDATQSDPNKQYKGWIGVDSLPELNKSSPSFRKFAYGTPDSIMQLWLDRGAAGWRMDVAPWVPDDFWREWRTAVKAHNPDALTVAEAFFDSAKFFLGDTFDTTMNYIFRNAVLEYAAGGTASKQYRNIELMREMYPPQSFYALMNLLSTHDSARSLFFFGYRDEKADAATIALAKQRMRLAVFFQMTFPGAPAVYYGDEVGVTGGEDPYNRATYPWTDRGGKPDGELLAEYKKLIKLRKDHPILRHGSIDAPLLADDHVIVLARKHGNTWAVTATNNAQDAKTVTVKLPSNAGGASFIDAMSGKNVPASGDALTFTIPPLYGVVLTTSKAP